MSAPTLARTRIVQAWTSSNRTRLVLAFGVVFYVVRVIAPRWRGDFDSFFPDSSSYVDVARLGPFDPSFWWSERPIGVPIAMWLTGNNWRVLFLVQTVLFALAVAHLCSVLSRSITSRWIAWVTCAAIASVAFHPRFGLWHLEILTESLSLSLSVFMISTWLMFSFEPTRRRLVVAAAVTALWMSVRDSHIVFGVVVAAALVITVLTVRSWTLRRTASAAAAVLVAFAAYVLVAQSVSDRNLQPLINTVGERVLTDPDVTKTFADRGMPLDEALRERTGSDSWADDQKFLLSPDLAEFRNWARTDGRRALMTSLVLDSPYWTDVSYDALVGSLGFDFREYDRYSTSERLPTRLFWFQGPRTPEQLAIWSGAAAVGLIAIALRRRRLAVVGLVAIAATCADIVVSASGDSVEVPRHLLGSIFRLSLLLIVLSALGLDALVRLIRRRTEPVFIDEASSTEKMPLADAVSGAAFILGVFGTWIALEHRSRDFDPQYVRTIVERAARFGGSYYENGIHNKGPFETLVYDSVRLFTSYDTYWFGISAYVVIASLLLGSAAGIVAHSLGASRRLAATAAALVFAHFTLSNADYAGVLYSRNITTAILAIVVAATIWERPWRVARRAPVVFAMLFALLGLAVQTLLTTILTAAVVGAFLYLRRSSALRSSHPLLVALGSASATLLAAPIWYAMRGSFREFWSSWWTYAGYMSASTGRSLLDQIGLGFQQMIGYYQQRPWIPLLVLVFVHLLRRNWALMSTATRTLHVALLAWFGAAWIELVLSQRYSSHYFSVIAVPTAFIGVATAVVLLQAAADRSGAWLRPSNRGPVEAESVTVSPRSQWIPVVSVLVLLAVQGTDTTWIAIESAGSYRNASHYVAARESQRTGSQETRQAVIDLVSSPDDPLLAWTMYPWTYLDHRRVPATRFSWKSFLIGEIYLGRTSPEYVLDDTWKWFSEDIAESQPRVYARPQVTDLVVGTPFADLVSRDFVTVFADEELEIGWQRDQLTRATRTFAPISEAGSEEFLPEGWSFDPQTRLISIDSPGTSWSTPMESCQRLGTRIERTSSSSPTGLRFEFLPLDANVPESALAIDFESAWSERNDGLGDRAEAIELDSTQMSLSNSRDLEVVLLVTNRSAALLVEGLVVAAISLSGPQSISIAAIHPDTTMTKPSIDDIDGFAGC